MRTVSVAEAKVHLSEILNQVETGQEVVITRRGRPVARLATVRKAFKPLPLLSGFRASMPKSKTPSAEIIRKMRDEGR
ncbi:MAG: type II toxin-antitoxin system prevent-host-death family antitoxin [Nitrospirae bacterium]|nr:type II toxin-antitoxin system prevent-host-death family antitoxin [Nitrospirota bacterium]